LALLPFAIAAVVLVGWETDTESLKLLGLASVAMNPVTAVGFILFTAGLFIRFSLPGRSATLAGVPIVAAGLIGASKMTDLVFGTHSDVDSRLFAASLAGHSVMPNRIAPHTALDFMLAAIALLLMTRPGGRSIIAAQAAAFAAILVAMFAVVGHLYGVVAFYAIAALHPMALHSAVAFLCLSFFVLIETSGRGLLVTLTDTGPAGRTSRVLLPAALVIPVLLGWLRHRGQVAGFYPEAIGVALMGMLTALSMAVLIWYNGRSLLVADRLRILAKTRILHMASHDYLTSLPNRSHFMDRLTARMAALQRPGETFAIIFMDLDGFKQVNDRLGHAAGDALLRQVGLSLQRCGVRPNDLVARIGGDEFAMILDRIGCPDEAASVAARIVGEMVSQFGPPGEEVPVSISMGIVIATPRHETPEALMKDADGALYEAKRTGRGHFVFYPEPERDLLPLPAQPANKGANRRLTSTAAISSLLQATIIKAVAGSSPQPARSAAGASIAAP
jgi:diguanylate cyclase (GGDEF)-like protein